jgi:hypothetical protein
VKRNNAGVKKKECLYTKVYKKKYRSVALCCLQGIALAGGGGVYVSCIL